MANSDKNILITPNRSQTAQPNVVFTGQGNVPITLRVLDDSYGTLSFEGSAGQLFSINNNLSTGTIFSVNDVSGIPMIDVDASGLVRLAPLGGTVYSNTLYGVTKTVAGAGNSVTIRAADGVTSGAGGNILLLPGLQATTGGDGKIIVRQPGGTAGTNEVQMWHDGSQFHIKNFTAVADYGTSSSIILKSSNDFGVQIGRVGPGTVGIYPVGTSTISLGNPSSQTVYAGWWYSNYATGAWEPNNSTYPINWTDVGFYRGSVRQLVVGNYSSGGGSLCYTSSTPSALSTNPTNDLALSGSAFQRLSSSSALAVTGIAPPSGGAHVDGRIIWLHNVGSFNITLKHSQTSTAANQFINEGGGDIVLGPNRIVQCTYDSTSTKWRVNGETYPYNFPTTDGTSGQVLSTNGSGTLSWATALTTSNISGTTNYLSKFTSANVVGNSQIFDNGTNVGVGTATPNSKVTIGTDFASITGMTIDTGSSTDSAIVMRKAASKAAMGLLAWDAESYVSSGTYYDGGAWVHHNSTSNSLIMQLDTAGGLYWYASSNGSASWNVANGINLWTTNGTWKQPVDAVGTGGSGVNSPGTALLRVSPSAQNTYAALELRTLNAGTYGGAGLMAVNDTNYDSNLLFYTNPAGSTTRTEQMRITKNGDVGIGTSSPATKLHVVGAIRSSGYTAGDGTYLALTGDLPGYSANTYPTLRSDGSIYFSVANRYAAYLSSSDNSFGIANTSTQWRVQLHPNGTSYFTGGALAVGATTAAGGGQVYITPQASGTKGLVVRAAASQSVNLTEWQTSAGQVNAYFASDGKLSVLQNTQTQQGGVEESVASFGHKSFWSNADAGLISVGFTDIAGTYNSTSNKWDMYFKTGDSSGPSGRTERLRILGSNGFVGIGTKTPNSLLTVAGNAATSQINIYKSPDGSINSAQQVASLGTGSSNSNTGTTGGNEYGILQLLHNGTVRCQLYAYTGGGGSNNFVLDSMAFGTTSATPGQVYITPTANTTKALVVRGAASQSANLQEWQNSSGTALATLDSSGGFYSASASFPSFTNSGTFNKSLWTNGASGNVYKEFILTRTLPDTVGDYVELFEVNHTIGSNYIFETGGVDYPYWDTTTYEYSIAWDSSNYVIPPKNRYHRNTSDYVLEKVVNGAYLSRFRLRRIGAKAHTSSSVVSVRVQQWMSTVGNDSTTLLSGTGTSTVSGYGQGLLYCNPWLSAPPPLGWTGAGTNLTLTASDGVTSGAGGSIILQPGAQATTGGDGQIIIRKSGTSDIGAIYPITNHSVGIQHGSGGTVGYTEISRQGYNGTYYLRMASNTTEGITGGATIWSNQLISLISGGTGSSDSDIPVAIYRRPLLFTYSNFTTTNFGAGLKGSLANGVLRVCDGTGTTVDSGNGGSLAFKSNTTSISTATNDLVLNGSAFQRLNCTTACNLTGVAPPTGGSHIDGRMIRIYNVGTANLTLKHNSTSSAIANRFCCVQAVDIILAPRDYAELIYDGTDGGLVGGQNNPCWRVH